MKWYTSLAILVFIYAAYYLYQYEGRSIYLLARQQLLTSLGCNYPRCLKDFDEMEFDINVNNEDQVCLLITVFLMCIKKNCVLTKPEFDLEFKSLRTLLRTKNIFCDFHFDHYRSDSVPVRVMQTLVHPTIHKARYFLEAFSPFKSYITLSSECLFSGNECRNRFKKETVDSPHSKCRDVLTLLECVSDGCPMSIPKQLDMFDRKEKHLRSLGIRCDFDKMKYKFLKEPKCSNPNMFVCKNKACVHKSFRCDSVNDCGDNSDENKNECYSYAARSFSLKGKKRK